MAENSRPRRRRGWLVLAALLGAGAAAGVWVARSRRADAALGEPWPVPRSAAQGWTPPAVPESSPVARGGPDTNGTAPAAAAADAPPTPAPKPAAAEPAAPEPGTKRLTPSPTPRAAAAPTPAPAEAKQPASVPRHAAEPSPAKPSPVPKAASPAKHASKADPAPAEPAGDALFAADSGTSSGAESLADGSAPGPEYTIKGNAGSMLFHPPSSPYFKRTKAEVWFRTAEEATAAGFTEWTPKKRSSD
jgi:outer membrane biosynthesis protein TonB